MTDHPHRRATDAIHALLLDGKSIDWRDVVGVVANVNETLVEVAESLKTLSKEVNARLDAQDMAADEARHKADQRDIAQAERDRAQAKLFNEAVGGYRVLSKSLVVVGAILSTSVVMFGAMGSYIVKGYIDVQISEVARNNVQDRDVAAIGTSIKVLETNMVNANGAIIDLQQRIGYPGTQRPKGR